MLERLKSKLETGALIAVLLTGLSICVIAFLAVACFLGLAGILPAPLAALVTAAAAIVLIAVVLVIAKLLPGETTNSAQPANRASTEQAFESILRQQVDPALSQWIKANPDKAALMTLVLGVAAGYSESVRRALIDTYMRRADTASASD